MGPRSDGLCPWTPLGDKPQTLVIGSRSALTIWAHMAPQSLYLDPPLYRIRCGKFLRMNSEGITEKVRVSGVCVCVPCSGCVQHVDRGVVVPHVRPSTPRRRHAPFQVTFRRVGPLVAVGARRLVPRHRRRRSTAAAASRQLRPTPTLALTAARPVGPHGRPGQVPGRPVLRW